MYLLGQSLLECLLTTFLSLFGSGTRSYEARQIFLCLQQDPDVTDGPGSLSSPAFTWLDLAWVITNCLLNLSLPRTLNLHYNKIFPARDPQRRGRGGIMLSVHPGGYYICDLGTSRHRGSSSTVGLDIEKKSCNLFWNWRDFILFWKPSR